VGTQETAVSSLVGVLRNLGSQRSKQQQQQQQNQRAEVVRSVVTACLRGLRSVVLVQPSHKSSTGVSFQGQAPASKAGVASADLLFESAAAYA